jgi:hypothetical protein
MNLFKKFKKFNEFINKFDIKFKNLFSAYKFIIKYINNFIPDNANKF